MYALWNSRRNTSKKLELTSILLFLLDYSKLPSEVTVDLCFLLDPLIATGGTASAALQMLLDWGLPSEYGSHSSVFFLLNIYVIVNKIKLLAVLGSETGLKKIAEEFPDLEVA